MLTIRMLTSAPFAIRVPKSSAKSFTGRGIVATFDPPTITTVPELKRQEFAVYTNVPETLWTEYLATESDEDRAAVLARFGTPSHASSPVAVTEREFDSWMTVSGSRQNASRLLAGGVVAYEPKRAAKTDEAGILSAIDSVFALLGRDVPSDEDEDESEDETTTTQETEGETEGDAPTVSVDPAPATASKSSKA